MKGKNLSSFKTKKTSIRSIETFFVEKNLHQYLSEITWRKEFSTEMLALDLPDYFFQKLQWTENKLLFLIYRTLIMLYTTTISFSSLNTSNESGWLVRFCSWNYILMTCHCVLAYFTATFLYARNSKIVQMHTSRYSLDTIIPEIIETKKEKVSVNFCYFKLDWLIFILAQQSSILSIFIYVISPPKNSLGLTIPRFHFTIMSFILVMIEMWVTCFPVRLMHVFYSWYFFNMYILFSIFFWLINNLPLYRDFIDWNQAPMTLFYLCFIIVVIQPLIQLFNYAMFRLKCYIFLNFFEKPSTKE